MRKRLLLADDSITIQRVIELTFADEPIDVEAVSDGAAAIARLDASPPDILLADIGMPGRDGYEVALHVRRTPRLAHIPVLLLTGAFDPVDHARTREAGCAGVLAKPFDPQMLIARVRQLLDSSFQPSPAVRNAPGEAGGPAAAFGAPASRASDPEEYFARLDRAFASLTPPGPDADAPSGGQAAAIAPAAAEATLSAGGLDSGPADREDASSASPPGGGRTSGRAGAASPARPTLGDAFAALVAIEQGWGVPELSDLAGELFLRELVDRVAGRVSRDASERVVREVAPAIVSELAERLVREQIARLQLERPTQYDRRS